MILHQHYTPDWLDAGLLLRHKQIVYTWSFACAGMPMKSKSSTTTRAPTRVRESRKPIHPGAFLAEGLSELGLSQAGFSRTIGVSPMRVSHVVNGARPVTAELALLFGKAFGQSPQYWLNLQRQYDLEVAERSLGARLEAVEQITSEGVGDARPGSRPVS